MGPCVWGHPDYIEVVLDLVLKRCGDILRILRFPFVCGPHPRAGS